MLGSEFLENGGDSEWGFGNWCCEERILGFKKGRRRSAGSGEELRDFFVLGFLLLKKK